MCRAATPKLVTRSSLRDLQTALMMRGKGLLSKFMRYCRCLPAFTAMDVEFANIFKIPKVSVKGVKKQHQSEFLLVEGRVEYIFIKFLAEIYFFRQN